MRKQILIVAVSLLMAAAVYANEHDEKERPMVQMQTSLGTITLELYADKAPETVKNFLHYVEDGFYEGTVFHRVIRNFMIQGGGFDENLQRKPTREPIRNEAANGLRNNRGTIAMARTSNPHSATSQFYINTVNNDSLNFRDASPMGIGYCVFGRVTDGMDVVDALQTQETGTQQGMQNVPLSPIIIQSVTRIQSNDSENE